MRSFFLHSGFTGLYSLLQHKKIWIAGVIYFGLSAFILHKYGINTNGEATKYIEDARHILNEEKLRIRFFSTFYLTYSLIVAFFIKFSFNFHGVAIVQILLSFIAACSIYKLLLDLTCNYKISFAAFIMYMICLPVQKWNFFLYTESIYTSLTVIALYFFYCVHQKKQFKKWWTFCFLLLLIIFCRPVGLIFLIAGSIIYLLWLIKKEKKQVYYPFTIGFIIIGIILLQSPLGYYFNPDSLKRMEIICQVPQSSAPLNYKEYNSSGLAVFFQVIFTEIGLREFLIIGFKKLGSFFGMVREFYSLRHNIILIVTATILYPLAIAGILFFKNKKTFYLKAFLIICITLTSIGVFFTCDEWSNRFVAPVIPQIIILAALGFNWIKMKIIPPRSNFLSSRDYMTSF